jgi:hypothetical protein
LISERAFWFGAALYAALLVAATTVFGGTVPQTETGIAWKANSAGTLISGIREQPEINDGNGANDFLYQSHQTRGALTLRLHTTFGFGWGLSRRSLNDPLIELALHARIADLTSARTNAPRFNDPIVSRAGDLGITPMQIALADQSVFVDEETTAARKPATWFAAALVASVIAWRQRHRFTRNLARRIRFRANWLSPIIVGSFFIGVASASADLAPALPEMGDLTRWGLFSLGNNGLQLSGSTVVEGDVGTAGNGIISMRGHAMIDGNLYYRSNSILVMSSNARIAGARYHNRDSQLDNGLNEASSASNHAFALEPTRSYTDINLSRNQSTIVQGAPGETVVLKLQSFALSGNATFTLQGTATTTFIINVTKQFSLSGHSKIVLSGGVQWDNVLFNVRGQGNPVRLSGHSRLEGILMANQRTVKLRGHSTVSGEVIANKVLLRNAAQIIHPPTVSP